LRDSAFHYVDDITTPNVESLEQQVTLALRRAAVELQGEDKSMEWWKQKNTSIYHLLRTAVLPFARTGIPTGGSKKSLNAMSATHGPSWRMVVHLTPQTEAYGVYPGGQSGNPGSRFYDSFVDTWAASKYYRIWVMQQSEAADKRAKWKISFSNS
jgi:penicillin G amidase